MLLYLSLKRKLTTASRDVTSAVRLYKTMNPKDFHSLMEELEAGEDLDYKAPLPFAGPPPSPAAAPARRLGLA